MKSSSDKHLTWKTCFPVVLPSAKRVSELHGLSYIIVRYSRGWRSCTFSFLLDFVAKKQNLSVYDSCIDEFTLPSLADFVDGDRDEMLLCPIRTIKRYLIRIEQFKSTCSSLLSR